jgi:hypothetical protein
MCIWWLVERTAGPHSTSLRAGSPLRYAPVGMTIHIRVRDASAQENCHPDKELQAPSVPGFSCHAALDKTKFNGATKLNRKSGFGLHQLRNRSRSKG